MKRKAFSLIEMLIVMSIMTILFGIAMQGMDVKLKTDLYKNIKSDMAGCQKITEKIINEGYDAPTFDFTSDSDNYKYIATVDNTDFNYVLSNSRVKLTQVRIFDKKTMQYTDYGIILDASKYKVIDKNGNEKTLLSKTCYVYNSDTDSKAYFTTDCTPDALNWDYQD